MYNLGSAAQGVNRETACVAEHVEQLAPFGVLLEQGSVLALVDKESGLLATQPVDVELQTILGRYVACVAAHDVAVVLVYVCLVGEGGVRLVVDVLYLVAKAFLDCFGNVHAVHVHAHAVCLHDSGVAVDIDDEAREVVALAVNKTVGGVVLA